MAKHINKLTIFCCFIFHGNSLNPKTWSYQSVVLIIYGDCIFLEIDIGVLEAISGVEL